MKLTEKENLLLRRALDPASSPNEAEMAMAAFARSLRKRGVSGYDFVPPDREARPEGPQVRPSDAPRPQPPPQAEPPPPRRHTPQPPPPQPEPNKWDFMRKAHEEAAANPPAPSQPPVGSYKYYRGGLSIVFILIGMVVAILSHNIVPLVVALFAVIRSYK
jgi:hypothetical protein